MKQIQNRWRQRNIERKETQIKSVNQLLLRIKKTDEEKGNGKTLLEYFKITREAYIFKGFINQQSNLIVSKQSLEKDSTEHIESSLVIVQSHHQQEQ